MSKEITIKNNKTYNWKQLMISILGIIVAILILFITQPIWSVFFSVDNLDNRIISVFEQKIIHILIVAFMLMYYLLSKRWLQQKIKNNFFKTWIVLTTLYSINRFNLGATNIDWYFYPLESSCKFLDVLVIGSLVLLLPIVFWATLFKKFVLNIFLKKKQKLTQKRNANVFQEIKLLSDSPDHPDKLGREEHAVKLCKKIISIQDKDSYSIGIEAEWGEGKSNFLRLMKEYFLNYNLAYVVEYSPYDSNNEKNLIIDLFLKIEKELKPINPNIISLLNRYSRSLTGLNAFGFSLNFLPFIPQETISSRKEMISNCIEKLDKPLVILIDELDRVGKDYILAVLQLIAQTARFRNTVFVTAYSSRYIISMLKDIDEADIFLEKFFNHSYSLPKPSKEKIKDEAEKLLLSVLGDKNLPKIKDFFADYTGVYNLRTIKRLANSTYSSIDLLNNDERGENICMYDILLIQQLELLSPVIYNELGNNPRLFLTSLIVLGIKSNYSMPQKVPEDFELKKDTSFENIEMEMYAANNDKGNKEVQERAISKEEYIKAKIIPYCKNNISVTLESIYNIFQLLFSDGIRKQSNHIRLRNPIRFNEYFEKQLGEKQISEKDFSNFINSSSQIEPKVKEWHNKEKGDSLKMWLVYTQVTIENVERLLILSFCIDKTVDRTKNFIYTILFSKDHEEYSADVLDKIIDVFEHDGFLEQKIKALVQLISYRDYKNFIVINNTPQLLESCLKRYWKIMQENIFAEIKHEDVFHNLRMLVNDKRYESQYTQEEYNKLMYSFKKLITNNIKKWYEFLIIEENGKYRLRLHVVGFLENHNSIFETSHEFDIFLDEIKDIDDSLYSEFYDFYEKYRSHYEAYNSQHPKNNGIHTTINHNFNKLKPYYNYSTIN